MTTEDIVKQYEILASAFGRAVTEYIDESRNNSDNNAYLKRAEENMEEHKRAFYSFAKHDWQ